MLITQKILFNTNECNSIIDAVKSDEKYWKYTDRKYLSYSINLDQNTEWVFKRLVDFFETETDIKIKKLKNTIHFHKFNKGDWFDKHNDVRVSRLYAVGVLLNDNFEGGDFKLYNPNEIVLNKKIGNGYIFDVRINHEITPILYGVRYSLLWFLQNEHIKITTNKLI